MHGYWSNNKSRRSPDLGRWSWSAPDAAYNVSLHCKGSKRQHCPAQFGESHETYVSLYHRYLKKYIADYYVAHACGHNKSVVRLQESYQGIMHLWICVANPWICFESLITNPNFLRFPLTRRPQIRICFVLWIANTDLKRFVLSCGPWIHPIFKRFYLFSWFLPILTNLHESLALYAVQILKNKAKSIFVNLSPWICFKCDWWIQPVFKLPVIWIRFGDLFPKICFVDSIHNAKNLKKLNLYRFVVICILIPPH